jgi:hypothetical protein
VKRIVAAVIVLLVAGCAPIPTPTQTATLPSTETTTIPTASSVPSASGTPAVTSNPTAVVKVNRWSADCYGVPVAACEGVAALFINNLARSGDQLFSESHGVIAVGPRSECPRIPKWADANFCWQATALIASGPVCMVVAKQKSPRRLEYGQVGGSVISGRAGPLPQGWPTCV